MGSHNRSAHLQGHKDANMVTHFFSKGDVFMEAFSENLRQIAEFGNILMQVVSLGSIHDIPHSRFLVPSEKGKTR